MSVIRNVLGTNLEPCSTDPMTGFYRDGYCNCGKEDRGLHIVCVVMTDEFLEFSKQRGNDLSTPMHMYNFPGLKAGDQWCLCALRWIEAFQENVAPNIVLEATSELILDLVPLETLKKYAVKSMSSKGD